jgi:hypothetical protein
MATGRPHQDLRLPFVKGYNMNTPVKPPRKRKVTPGKVYNGLRRTGKGVYHLFKYDYSQPKMALFIVGCQRSGTTLMNWIFEGDLNAKVYPEVSKLSSEDPRKQLRLNPLPKVKAVLDKDRAPLIILKPLVESQNTLQLLDYFEDSKALRFSITLFKTTLCLV